ncbi:MAG TPA: Arc family DNA-binding protein [Cellulomonas sp.]
MAQILVRNLPDTVKDGLRRRAERHHRSVEAEAREILAAAVDVDPVLAWLDDSAELRDELGGVELPLPGRTAARPDPQL